MTSLACPSPTPVAVSRAWFPSCIKRQFPDLSNAAAQVKLKKAFGSDEAVKFLLQMSAGMESLEGNIQSVGRAMKTGTAVTEQMADAMNQDIGARFLLLRQQVANLSEILGRTLLPVVTPMINGVSRFILFLQRMAKSMPGVTRVVLGLSMALGTILVVAGAVTAGVFLRARNAGEACQRRILCERSFVREVSNARRIQLPLVPWYRRQLAKTAVQLPDGRGPEAATDGEGEDGGTEN